MTMRLLTPLLLLGCGGGGGANQATSDQALVPDSLLQNSWQIRVASAEAMGELAGKPAWQAYFKHDYSTALQAFGAGAGAARMHAELSGLYRQASRIQANAIRATYGAEQIREGDPLEVGYLLGVASWIAGDAQGVKDQMGAANLKSSKVKPLVEAVAQWTAADFEPGETSLFDPGAVQVGSVPGAAETPHFLLPEQMGEGVVEVTDPTQTIRLAEWHESAALQADPAAGRILDLWRLDWQPTLGGETLGLDGLFLGPWMSDADLNFVRAIQIAGEEPVAIQDWASKSAFAAALVPCVSKEVDAECVIDRAADLQSQLEAAMELAAGEKTADHPMLASHARVGLIRAAARLARNLQDEKGEGLLRLAALDASDGPALDPLYQLSMSAWDTHNRNPHRAQALLHEEVSRAPGLDAARYSLNVLYLRVSRDAGDGIPMH
jgi:hypothetical protein